MLLKIIQERESRIKGKKRKDNKRDKKFYKWDKFEEIKYIHIFFKKMLNLTNFYYENDN